jgi:ssDNA-specific exonuclease RecJ
METKNEDVIFTINKDPEKKEFIKSHTFDKIKQYVQEKNIA